MVDISKWTYGVEHEIVDWPRSRQLPRGFSIDQNEKTLVNSNGIAVDPRGETYPYGGEVNTPPTSSIREQGELLEQLVNLLPEAKINYRCSTHMHIRIPGLRDNLDMMKLIQRRTHTDMPRILPITTQLEIPIVSRPHMDQKLVSSLYRRWLSQAKAMYCTLLRPDRLEAQMGARTFNEFFDLEPPLSKEGKPLYHLSSRVCVNLRHLKDTDTFEFRYWPATLDSKVMCETFRWSRSWLLRVLNDEPVDDLIDQLSTMTLPKLPMFDPMVEERYHKTSLHLISSRDEIKNNVAKILAEDNDE